jgi:hypothetical protein
MLNVGSKLTTGRNYYESGLLGTKDGFCFESYHIESPNR